MEFEDEDGREPGFFYSVSGIPEKACSKKRNLRFHFTNMSNQAKLLSFEHKPIALEVSEEDYQDLISGKKAFYEQDWRRIPTEVEFINKDNKFGIVFEYPLRDDMKATDRVLFAYTYPFNLQDIEYSVQEVQRKCLAHEDVYFKKK